MTDEEWRPISGFEGLYEVSNAGRVKSLARDVVYADERYGLVSRRAKGRVLKLRLKLCSCGYVRPTVHLSIDGRDKTFIVARLVAEAFIGPRPTGHDIAHSDGVSTNNRATNLRYATRLENAADQALHGTQVRGERCGTAKLTARQVAAIRAARGREFCRVTAARFGVSPQHISKIQLGKLWSHL